MDREFWLIICILLICAWNWILVKYCHWLEERSDEMIDILDTHNKYLREIIEKHNTLANHVNDIDKRCSDYGNDK